jgi:hypothetical protein
MHPQRTFPIKVPRTSLSDEIAVFFTVILETMIMRINNVYFMAKKTEKNNQPLRLLKILQSLFIIARN